MFVVGYDNFLWNPVIPVTFSGEVNSCPFEYIRNIDPTLFWQIEATSAWFKLDCSLTGTRKPFFFGLYNHNLPVGATIKYQTHSSDNFTAPVVNQLFTVEADYYNFWTAADTANKTKAFNKFAVPFNDVLNASVPNKAWQRILIEGANNPIRLGTAFVGSVIALRVSDDETIDEGYVQSFNDPSTIFFALDGSQYSRIRKINHILKIAVSSAGLATKLAIKRLIHRVGIHQPCFLSFPLADIGASDLDKEYTTRTYYGIFTKLPKVDESAYGVRRDIDIEKNALVDYDFEFTELV